MRVVLDTNVLVSALVGHGKPRRLLAKLLEGHEIVSSKQMLIEREDVLSRSRFGFTRRQINKFLSIMVRGSTVATVTECPMIISKDPDDDVVLATALEGRAGYVVSGDRHLLRLKEYKGIMILPVSDMLKRLAQFDTLSEG
jgi:putative PIN family toxin of toxin-antitoxin system